MHLLQVNVARVQFESGKMIQASKYGQVDEVVAIELTNEEEAMLQELKVILNTINM